MSGLSFQSILSLTHGVSDDLFHRIDLFKVFKCMMVLQRVPKFLRSLGFSVSLQVDMIGWAIPFVLPQTKCQMWLWKNGLDCGLRFCR
jgi:hypothetical protein